MWRQNITTSGSKRLEIETTSPIFSNQNNPVNTHLEELWESVENSDSPIVLWNTRPASHLNLLHLIYLEKLKELQKLGFKTTILVFDKYHREVTEVSEPKRSERNAVKFSKKLAEYGLNEDKTEIILETDLRFCINSDKLLETMIALSNLKDTPEKFEYRQDSQDISRGLIRNTIEIYYESVIDCDVILSSSSDLNNVWEKLRSKIIEGGFFEGHEEPLVLGVPTVKVNNQMLSPTESSFVGEDIEENNIRENLYNYDQLREIVFEYIVLPRSDGRMNIDGQQCASFSQLNTFSVDKQVKIMMEHIKDCLYPI